ncbi:hypothetical protein AX16_007400 [Volvariella volvacea WC 439]|nr:hypothetical protein AX16_007400 [Volvariella volvacea WC 439]
MALLSGRYIPSELLDTIVSHIQDETQSLQSCSLISRSFTEPAQRRLFYKLHLYLQVDDVDRITEEELENLQRLEGLSESHIPLGYVHVLRVTISSYQVGMPILLKIFDGLINLERISIRCSQTLDEEFARHICKPTLTHISITMSKGFPTRFLRRCQALQQLSLHDASLSTSELEMEDLTLPQVDLRTLYLSYFLHAGPFIPWIQNPQCPLKISNITALAIDALVADHFQAVLPLVSIFSSSLKSLFLSPPREFSSLEGAEDQLSLIDLSILRQLRFLSFSITETHNTTYFPWVKAELATISASNQIQEFHLFVAINAYPRDLAFVEALSQRWRELDSILSQHQFDSLRIIYLHFGYENQAEVEIWVEKTMLKTKKSKLLIVDASNKYSFLSDSDNFPRPHFD